MVLRCTCPDLDRGFCVPGGPIIPVLAIIACLWLMLNLSAPDPGSVCRDGDRGVV